MAAVRRGASSRLCCARAVFALRPMTRRILLAWLPGTLPGTGAARRAGADAADRPGNAVPPGQTYRAHRAVRERAGPGPNGPSSVVWGYRSHVDSMRDTNAGLMGAILVTRRGSAKPDGAPTDV